MRWVLPWRERERRKELEAAFQVTKTNAIRLENGKFPGLSLLFNIGLYVLIAERDIQAAKIDALTHPNEWTRKLHARLILLTIYEWDADAITGRRLKSAMELMLIPDELRQEAHSALRGLRSVQEKASYEFRFIRNAAIAHRDPDALLQYRAIRDLDVQRVLAVGAEFYTALAAFLTVLIKLMMTGKSLPSLARQWSSASKA
jgi:hypothetical protein